MDTTEMINGSKLLSSDCNYIAFVDKAEKNVPPSIWRFEGGKKELVKQFDADFYNSDPSMMSEILEFIVKKYPAKSYGLVLWGHATAWFIENDTVATSRQAGPRYAYGRDTGNNSNSGENIGKSSFSVMVPPPHDRTSAAHPSCAEPSPSRCRLR